MKIKNFLRKLSLCLFLPALISCQKDTKNTVESNEEPDLVSDTVTQSVQEVAAIPFPKNIEILLPTQYRKESTGYPKNVKNKEWYTLYKNSKTGKWNIEKTALKITYGRDECVGEDVMIISSPQKNPALFFTPFEGLAENPTTILEDKMLFPEHPVSFNFKGKGYHLSPLGSCLGEDGQIMTVTELKSKTNEELDNNTKISDYRLSFGTAENSSELVTIESIEYATPRLVWAGDLNNDGLPDLILSLPDFYESQHLYFFLSDKNDPKKPLKKVADLLVVNDC